MKEKAQNLQNDNNLTEVIQYLLHAEVAEKRRILIINSLRIRERSLDTLLDILKNREARVENRDRFRLQTTKFGCLQTKSVSTLDSLLSVLIECPVV